LQSLPSRVALGVSHFLLVEDFNDAIDRGVDAVSFTIKRRKNINAIHDGDLAIPPDAE
jgi:hypothetical protein